MCGKKLFQCPIFYNKFSEYSFCVRIQTMVPRWPVCVQFLRILSLISEANGRTFSSFMFFNEIYWFDYFLTIFLKILLEILFQTCVRMFREKVFEDVDVNGRANFERVNWHQPGNSSATKLKFWNSTCHRCRWRRPCPQNVWPWKGSSRETL